MFNLSHRKTIFRLSIIGIFVIAALSVLGFMVTNKINYNVDAAAGDSASISPGYQISYGSEGWATNLFDVTVGGSTHRGFCANPSLATPSGSYTVHQADNSQKYNLIKLLIYIYENNNSVTAGPRAAIYDWSGDSDDYYAWTHAIIGVIYSNDYYGASSNASWLNAKVDLLKGYINSDADVWAVAKNYTLYYTDGGSLQDIVWIESNYQYGSVTVKKCDLTTSACTPQGNADFSGIKFEIYNNSGSKIYNQSQDQLYANGALVDSGTTNSSGEITFSNLIAGGASYLVKEVSTNTSYELTATSGQTATLSSNGANVTLNFYDQVKLGEVTVNKIDKDTGSCAIKTSELNFLNTKIQLVNNSTNSVSYGGNTYAKGAVIDTKTFGANTCSVTFENLPYGSYLVQESAASEGYVRNTKSFEVTVPTDNSYSVSTTVDNQPIRGDIKFVKKDTNNDKAMPNTLFSISALDQDNNVKETHLVVSNENGVVNTASSFALHSNHTNGYDVLYDLTDPITFQGYGTWFGINTNGTSITVNDEEGALPYGTYIVQELKCGANLFCTGVMNQKITVEITTNGQVVDLGDWDNACAKFSLETEATDGVDGDHYVEASSEVEIIDTINYCVKSGMDFVIKGTLMDKNTGEPLLVDGQKIESLVNLNSEEDCGTVKMPFKFDAEGLAGAEIVVFESLYYKDDLITSHEDIDDEAQTVEIISLSTYAVNEATNDKTLPLDEDVIIKDTVKYCLVPGHEYVVKGVLMNKDTKAKLLVNGEPVEAELSLTPEESCGEAEMKYAINTTDLAGAELVIFESLYVVSEDDEDATSDEDGEGNEDGVGSEEKAEILILAHEDFNNSSETVSVEFPAPETGLFTSSHTSGKSTDGAVVYIVGAAILLVFGGYGAARLQAKRRIFKK